MSILHTIKIGTGAVYHKVLGKRRPLFVMFLITNRCPYRCYYCRIPQRIQKELSTDEIKGLIDELADAGTQLLAIFGGEPFTREDLGEIVAYAKEKNMMVIVDSTGFGAGSNTDTIRQLDKLVISFDGAPYVSDRLKGESSYKYMTEAIAIAKKEGTEVSSFTVLIKENIDSINYILSSAEKLGFKATFKIPHLNRILGKSRDECIAAKEEYREVFKKLIEEKGIGRPVAHSKRTLEALIEWPDPSMLTSESENYCPSCMAGKLYCCIDSDGNVYPCPGTIKTMDSKNFLTDGFLTSFEYSGKLKRCRSCCISFLIEINRLLSFSL